MLFGKFHADSSDSGVLYKNPTSPTSSLLSFFSFSSLFNFTFLYHKAINEYYHVHLLTVVSSEEDSIVLNLTLTNRDIEFQVRSKLSLALVDGLLDLLKGGVLLIPFCSQ